MEPRFIIYGLSDPFDQSIRYIGKSAYGFIRPNEHWSESKLRRERNPFKVAWIRELKSKGKKYGIVVLEKLEVEDHFLLNELEKKWISHGRASNWPLTNMTAGGDGLWGYKHSPETRRKISTANTGNSHPHLVSEETRQKLRLANKGKSPSRNTIEAARLANTGRRLSPEHKRKMIAGIRAYRHPLSKRIEIAKHKGMREFTDPDGEIHQITTTAAMKYGLSRGFIRNVLAGERRSKIGEFKYVE